MSKINSNIGELVKNYRLKKGLTQLQLGTQLGYDSPQFVSFFERGLSKVPLLTLGKLIKILGLPEKQLYKMLTDDYVLELKRGITSGKDSF